MHGSVALQLTVFGKQGREAYGWGSKQRTRAGLGLKPMVVVLPRPPQSKAGGASSLAQSAQTIHYPQPVVICVRIRAYSYEHIFIDTSHLDFKEVC